MYAIYGGETKNKEITTGIQIVGDFGQVWPTNPNPKEFEMIERCSNRIECN